MSNIRWRDKDKELLKQTVKKYNAKVDRINKKVKDDPYKLYLPKINIKDLTYDFSKDPRTKTAGIYDETPIVTRKDFNRKIKSMNRLLNDRKATQISHTKRENAIEKANRKREATRKAKKEAEAQSLHVSNPYAYGSDEWTEDAAMTYLNEFIETARTIYNGKWFIDRMSSALLGEVESKDAITVAIGIKQAVDDAGGDNEQSPFWSLVKGSEQYDSESIVETVTVMIMNKMPAFLKEEFSDLPQEIGETLEV